MISDEKEYDYESKPQGANFGFGLKKDKRIRPLLEAIKSYNKQPRILEIGMGQGRLLNIIHELHTDAIIYGMDISKSAIDYAKNNNKINGKFSVGDAESLNYKSNYFDVVIIMDVLEHVEYPDQVISEVYRVLKPKGMFHLYCPCEKQSYTLDKAIKKYNLFGLADFTRKHFGHIQDFTHTDVKNIVKESFDNVDISIQYSSHTLSQILYLFILYLPKHMISYLGKDVSEQTRDAYIVSKKGIVSDLLVSMKYLWSLFSSSVLLLSEFESIILKNINFTAQGIHISVIK